MRFILSFPTPMSLISPGITSKLKTLGSKWSASILSVSFGLAACAQSHHRSWHFRVAYQYISIEKQQALRDPAISTAVSVNSPFSVLISPQLRTSLQKIGIAADRIRRSTRLCEEVSPSSPMPHVARWLPLTVDSCYHRLKPTCAIFFC